ncbi:MAG TPA: S41 family peptidase [Fimbriimonas sp.]|nr:S41 family peptidase [Fimbriimonas sp.]
MKIGLRIVGIFLAFAACMAFGFFWRDLGRGQAPSLASFERLAGMQVTSSKLSGPEVFSRNYHRLLTDYIRPVKPVELKYAGIEGMVSSLGDPHTIFLPPTAAKEFSEETMAKFGGVGARLSPDPLGAKVAVVFDDGPAFNAGLRKGNLITGVNGVSMAGKDIDSIVEKIKGQEGTVVKLTVVQAGKEKPVTMTVRRARITAPTVEGSVLPKTKIGYLAVSSFSEPTAMQFDHELAKLEDQGIQGLIIDLRGNPGGLLETATDMLSRFVENKVVVSMKYRDGREEQDKTSTGDLHTFHYPIVVLIDGESASAAEIFSGCLHDYGLVTLVGSKSYGKASVQNVWPLKDRSSAKITIARYYLPNGEYIGRSVDEDGVKTTGGLEPDVPVALNTDSLVVFGDPATDNQLAKAIQVVKSKMQSP